MQLFTMFFDSYLHRVKRYLPYIHIIVSLMLTRAKQITQEIKKIKN